MLAQKPPEILSFAPLNQIPMWSNLAEGIIRFRLPLMIVIVVITVIMGFYAARVEMSYDFGWSVPPNDPDMVFLTRFRQQFGEDGNIVAVGLQDSAVYKLQNFQQFRRLSMDLREIDGVNEVLSLPRMKIILKDTTHQRFYLSPLFPDTIRTQWELDSLLGEARKQKFYAGQLVNQLNGSTIMLVSIEKAYANSARRIKFSQDLQRVGNDFTQRTGIQLRYAGLVFIRSVVAEQVRKELSLFLYLSALVTGAIMLIFSALFGPLFSPSS